MESSLPGVELRPGDAFLGAELRDCQTAGFLATNAIAPSRVELGVGGSCHRVDSWKVDELVHFAGYQTLARMVISDAYPSSAMRRVGVPSRRRNRCVIEDSTASWFDPVRNNPMGGQSLIRSLPLRERVRGVIALLRTRRLVEPCPPLPGPLPQGKREAISCVPCRLL